MIERWAGISLRYQNDARRYFLPPVMHLEAASSKLASSRTIAAHFPPNSISIGLRYLPASDPISLPTEALPTNSIFLMAGWAINASVTAGASSRCVWMTLITSGGRPAWIQISTSMWCVLGHNSDALKTAVHPAPKIATRPRVARTTAAFHLS